MSTLIEKEQHFGPLGLQKVYEQGKVIYNDLYAGLGWPGALPGALVVVGVRRALSAVDSRVYVLRVKQAKDLPQLYDECQKAHEEMHVRAFNVGEYPENVKKFIDARNRATRGDMTPVVSIVPRRDKGMRGLAYELNLIFENTRPENKRLITDGEVENTGNLRAQFRGLRRLNYSDIREEHSPTVAALGYAVAAVERRGWEFRSMRNRPTEYASGRRINRDEPRESYETRLRRPA